MIEPKVFEVPGRTDVRVVLSQHDEVFLVTAQINDGNAWRDTQLALSTKHLEHAEKHLVPTLIQRAAELDAEGDGDPLVCVTCGSPKVRLVCPHCGRTYCDPCFAKSGVPESAPWCPACAPANPDDFLRSQDKKGCFGGCRPSYDVLEERYRAAKRELAIRSMQDVVRLSAPLFLGDDSRGDRSSFMDGIADVVLAAASKFSGAPDPVAEEAKDNLILSTDLLLKHGTHTEACDARETGSTKPCSCGWAEIEKYLRAAKAKTDAPPAPPAAG